MIDHHPSRILIAEDDPNIRRMLVVSLGREGYRTAEACNGREALLAMRAGQVDLVILDLVMPEVTGLEVLAERAGEAQLRRIPVIIITANRGDSVPAVLTDGICALLPKPFNLETLHALVTSCLDQVDGGVQA
ncbi:MAG: response regulator [Thermoanaerobaculia bacterium]